MSGPGVSGGRMSGWGVPGGVGSIKVMMVSMSEHKRFGTPVVHPDRQEGRNWHAAGGLNQSHFTLTEDDPMTDTNANPYGTDIVDDDQETPSARLDRQADALLRSDEDKTFGSPQPLRRAVREDAKAAADWSRTRAVRVRSAIEDEPVKSSVIALGVGVIIGLLLSR